MLRGAAVQKDRFPRSETAKYQQAMSTPGTMTAALNYYRQLFRRLPRTAKEANNRVRVPTLLIWGVHDIALDIRLTKGLHHWVDDIRVEYIYNSGHWVQQEQPDEVNRLILEFL